MAKKILIVDDDITFLLMVESFLKKKSFDVNTATKAEDGLALLSKHSYDLIISDFRLPAMDGIELLEKIRAKDIACPFFLLTSYGDIKLAVKAMKLGATDYLTKPVNPQELLEIVEAHTKAEQTKKPQNKKPPQKSNIPTYIEGKSNYTLKVNEHIKLVAPTNMSILIQGESGTGKEYIARSIHQQSKRKDKAFIAIDCGALSNELAASEFFGHIKGSFTGAFADKIGQFENANGGTLFLDEIGNLSYDIQVKLLRALQEKTIRKIGSNTPIDVDVRIIAATNENLQKAIENKEFREDLYHRLHEFKIEIAPLRQRPDEIPQFTQYFLEQANIEFEKQITGFSEKSMQLLLQYPWPGNLRELKNVVRRSVLLSTESIIKSKVFPQEILHPKKTDIEDPHDLKHLGEKLEKEKIIETLELVKFNKSKAAKILNIDRKTLYNKIDKYQIDL